MKKLNFYKLMLVIISISLMPISVLYAGINDKSDRLSNEQSSVFSPGYINATKQHTDEIIRQVNSNSSTLDRNVDNVDYKLTNNVDEAAVSKVNPELQKKTGGTAPQTKQPAQTQAATQTKTVDSTQYNVNIGTGTNKTYDSNGRLISEVINGTKTIYAGFSNVGTATIQDAINMANSGDMIIVKGGTYDVSGNEFVTYFTYGNYSTAIINDPTVRLNLKDGVSLYGGYDENGVRDIANNPSMINGMLEMDSINSPTEINGFTINFEDWQSYKADMYIYNSSNITIANSTFLCNSDPSFTSPLLNLYYAGDGYGIEIGNSSVTLKNNTFNIAGAIDSEASNITAISNTFNIPHFDHQFNFGIDIKNGSNFDSQYNNYNMSYDASVVLNSYNSRTGGWMTFVVPADAYFTSTNDYYSNNDYFSSQLLDVEMQYPAGDIAVNNRVTNPNTQSSDTQLSIANTFTPLLVSNATNITAAYDMPNEYALSQNTLLSNTGSYNNTSSSAFESNAMTSTFKSLLSEKGNIMSGPSAKVDNALIEKIITDVLRYTPQEVNALYARTYETDTALKLANILNNPTEDQKLMIDTIAALMNDTKKMEDKANASPESLKKAQDDLIQAVAALLIAQAIPDLLKDGDVSNIKGTFADLNTEKGKILFDYQESVKPYYDKMKEILSKNMTTLQLNNVIPGNMMAAELAKLEPNEIDKILEKLRKASNKSFEEDYILQQEAKYRKAYVDPNKKMLEEKMKDMMNGFTRRLSKILGETKSKGK